MRQSPLSRRWKGVAAGAALALVLTACGGSDGPDDGASDTTAPTGDTTGDTSAPATGLTPEGTLKIARPLTWPPSYNPHYDNDAPNLVLFNWVYEGLIRQDASGEFVPWLAESYEFSDDYLTLTFALKTGITFSDGTPFNADAAKQSLEFVIAGNPQQVLPGVQGQLANVASVEAPDETTLIINYDEPRPIESEIWLSRQAGIIVAPSALGSAGETPVGTGPFTIDLAASTADHTHVELAYNPTYWNAGTIGFERVTFDTIFDATAARQALEAGQYDVGVYNLELGEVSNTTEYSLGKGVPHYHYVFNDWQGDTIPQLADKDVRCAMAQTVNRADINAIWFNPEEQLLHQYAVSPEAYAYIDGYTTPEFDLEAAKTAFAATGAAPFAFETRTFPGATADTITAWSANLAQLGITLTGTVLDPPSGAQMFKNFQEGTYPVQWIPFEQANPLLALQQIAMPDGALNSSKAAPEGLAALVDQAAALPLAEAEPLIEQALQIMYDECIWVPLWEDYNGLNAVNGVKGVVRVPNFPISFYPQGIYRED